MMRIDKNVIRFVHTNLSDGLADEWRQAPLVLMPYIQYKPFLNSYVTDKEKLEVDFYRLEWMPFRRAVYCLEMTHDTLFQTMIDGGKDPNQVEVVTENIHNARIYLFVRPVENNDAVSKRIKTDYPGATVIPLALCTTVNDKVKEFDAFELSVRPVDGGEDEVVIAPLDDFHVGPSSEQKLSDITLTMLNHIYLWHKWVESEDHYYVEVKNKPRHFNSRKEIKKKPWKDDAYTIILALNRLPGEPKEHQGGTHASPRGHDRRGHWRRLTHPRFRNHPKYGQKIWIKPMWVGPIEKDYRGKIYRVIDPMPEQETSHAQNG